MSKPLHDASTVVVAAMLVLGPAAPGCAPSGGWDDDGSGILVWPEQGTSIFEGDVVRIWNRTDDVVSCWTSWLVFDPSTMDQPTLDPGDQATIPLDRPRDTDGLEEGNTLKYTAGFSCATEGFPAAGSEYARQWSYTTPPD